MQIRTAVPHDMARIRTFEHIGQQDPERFDYIENCIRDKQCWSICLGETVIGYIIINNAFYQRTFLSLLYIDQMHRNQGVGRQALQWVKEQTEDSFFVSTNLSNAQMIYLLRSEGFIDSGIIYNLDPADPEIIFYYDAHSIST